MWRGMLLGPVLGVAAASAALALGFGAEPMFQGGSFSFDRMAAYGALVPLFMALYAGPGAFLLSYPLLATLRRRRSRGTSPGNLLALAGAVGALLGLVNLLGILLLSQGPSGVADLFSSGPAVLPFLAAAAAGGLGLGLGCFWGLPKEEAPP
jgi:hypothetical protein